MRGGRAPLAAPGWGETALAGVYSCHQVATQADFKAMVLESVRRSAAEGRSPRRGEVLLIGQAASHGLIRLRIPRRYRLFDTWMVRGFIKQKSLEQLGIVVAKDVLEGQPDQFVLSLVNRGDPEVEAGSLDPKVERLSQIARQEWLGIRPPMLSLLGRPWPIALLVVALALDLVLGLERIGLVLAGYYIWFPIIPPISSEVLYVAYLVLVAVTAFALWGRLKAGYSLALTVAAVQLIRSIVVTIASTQSASIESIAWYLLGAWLFPAVILISLGLVYWEGRKRA